MGTRSGSKGSWKRAEQRLAAVFGAQRKPLSGSAGHADETTSDSKHATLYLESKYAQRHAVWTLYRSVRRKAQHERKTPVIGLSEARGAGVLLVLHSDDLPCLLAAYCAAKGLRLVKAKQ